MDRISLHASSLRVGDLVIPKQTSWEKWFPGKQPTKSHIREIAVTHGEVLVMLDSPYWWWEPNELVRINESI